MAINLFLGKYIPHVDETPLWDMYSDHFLHNHDIRSPHAAPRPHYIQWHVPVRGRIFCESRIVISSNPPTTSSLLTLPSVPEIANFKRGESVKPQRTAVLNPREQLLALVRDMADAEALAQTEGLAGELEVVAGAQPKTASGAHEPPSLQLAIEPAPDAQPASAPQPVVAGAAPSSIPVSEGGCIFGTTSTDEDLFATPASSPQSEAAIGAAGGSGGASASANPDNAVGRDNSDDALQQLRNIYLQLRRQVVAHAEFLPDLPKANDRFDKQVRKVFSMWAIANPTGSDFVAAARYLAAQYNLIDGWLDLPKTPPSQFIEDAWFAECYPTVLESLEDLYCYSMTTTAKLTAPANTPDCSPFRSVLPQMAEDHTTRRQYERLATNVDEMRQAPLGSTVEEEEEVDSDNEGAGSGGEDEEPAVRPTRSGTMLASDVRAARMAAAAVGPSGPLRPLPPLRTALATPLAETELAYHWHADPWRLGLALLEETNQHDEEPVLNEELIMSPVSILDLETARVDPATAATATAMQAAMHEAVEVPDGGIAAGATAASMLPSSQVEEVDHGAGDAAAPTAELHTIPVISVAVATALHSLPIVDVGDDIDAPSIVDEGSPTRAKFLSAAAAQRPSRPRPRRVAPATASAPPDTPTSFSLRRPSPVPQLTRRVLTSPTGQVGDGWPELRVAAQHLPQQRTQGSLETALSVSLEQLLSSALTVENVQRYQGVVIMAATGQAGVAPGDYEVLQTYMKRAQGHLTPAVNVARSGRGIPLRPLV